MSETQLASMYLGKSSFDDDDSRSQIYETSTMIHVLDGQNDVILDYITANNIIDDNHKKSLEDTLETYDFIAFGDRRYAEHLEKRNRIIIPDEDDTLREFVIFEAIKYRDTEGLKAQVFAHASYLELKKASILYPDNGFTGTASQHAGRALNNTGWTVGVVESSGSRTLTIEGYTNPYEMLRRIAREFEVELRFRIEHDGNKITGRYVDLLERIGTWQGREVEFGKDLDGIRRIEKQDIVTALLGLGPEDEDGNRLEVLVEDEDALQRWGRVDEHGNLHHLIEPYEIQSDRLEMTEEEAIQYTRTALDKRINTQVTYETTILDLEEVPGMENKQIRFGDTIRIKDTHFDPPLYLEARVFEQTRSIKSRAKKEIKLGDFIEYTEDEVHAIWRQLRNQIREKISHAELVDYTYNKLTIDNKDQAVRTDVESYANTVSSDAKDEAITYTNNTINPIRVKVENLEDEVDDQGEKITQAQTDITQAWDEINLKANQAYVDVIEGRLETAEGVLSVLPGQIELKANASDVYTKTEIDASFNALEGQIELKVDDGQARSIFQQEASSFTFSADQINFDGHVFGSNATFDGKFVREDNTRKITLDGTGIDIFSKDAFGGLKLEASHTDTGTMHPSGGALEFYLLKDGKRSVTSRIYPWEYGLNIEHTDAVFIEAKDPDFGTVVLSGNSIQFRGRVQVQNASGASNALELPNDHMISSRQGNFTLYPNRASGNFEIRSHDNKSSYRNDFWIRSDDGTMYSPPTYSNTSSNQPNLRIAADDSGDYRFYRTTSSAKYKADIKPSDIDYYKILDLDVFSWVDKKAYEDNGESSEGLQRHHGLIAEDLERVGLDQFVDYINGEIENYDQRVFALLIPIVRDLKERIDNIEQRSNV